MKTYEIALTITDSTSVDAESEEEAIKIAQDIFRESGYYDIDSNAELDVIGVSDDESEEK